MDQRILPGLEPLDTRQAVSQRLEGLEGDPQDLQWGLEPKAAVDGPPSVLVAGPRLTVRPPLTAATAIFALKAGLWFQRSRLFMLSPDSRGHGARRQAETPLSVLCRLAGPVLQPPVFKSMNY